jgi:hypothetical protein
MVLVMCQILPQVESTCNIPVYHGANNDQARKKQHREKGYRHASALVTVRVYHPDTPSHLEAARAV